MTSNTARQSSQNQRTGMLARPLLLVFAVASVTGLGVTFVVWRSQGLVDSRPDPYWFSAMAQSLIHGNGFDKFGTLLHRRTPLYPFFVAALYEVFGVHELPVQIAQVLLFAGTCTLAADAGRRLYNARTGVIAGLLCALHPSLLRYVPDFHLETLLTFLLTGAVWLSVIFTERPNFKRGVAFGVACGLASLTKAVVLLYPVIFGLAWLWSLRARFRDYRLMQSHVLSLGAAAVAMVLTISPWTVRNYYATGGHFVPISTGFSDAFLRGYVFSKTEYATLQRPPYTDGENEANAMFRAICAADGKVWEADDLETDKLLNKAAKAQLAASPVLFVRKSLVGLFAFWYEMTSLKNSLAAGGMALVAWALALIGWPRSRREGRPAWILFVPILYLNLLLAMLLALGRYSVPVLPCLLVLAAFGVDTLLVRREVSGASMPAGGAGV
jgi:4-amino-4-deoxy-L-arabinose transferase-like glycosyltransferase